MSPWPSAGDATSEPSAFITSWPLVSVVARGGVRGRKSRMKRSLTHSLDAIGSTMPQTTLSSSGASSAEKPVLPDDQALATEPSRLKTTIDAAAVSALGGTR